MDAKKVNEELQVVNDTYNMTYGELKEKYLKDEDTFNYFLSNYSDVFTSDLMFQVRALPAYNKVSKIFHNGQNEFPNVQFDKYQEYTLNEIDNHKVLNDELYVNEYYLQAIWLFLNFIGIEKIKGKNDYFSVVDSVVYASARYNQENSFSLTNFYRYVNTIVDEVHDEKQLKECYEKYVNDHPLLKECNDKSFLLFVNYMINFRKRDVDSNLIDDATKVIYASKIARKIDKDDTKNYKEYDSFSKFTLKSIKKYTKEKENKEKKEKKKIKQLLK